MDNGLRKCIVNGSTGYFHGVFQFAQPVPADLMVGGAPGGQLAYPIAVVEKEDGSINYAQLSSIRFLGKEEAENG